jgi:hypothetical protein
MASEVAGRPAPDQQRPGTKHLAPDGFSNSSPALATTVSAATSRPNSFQICVPERTGIEDLKPAPNGGDACPCWMTAGLRSVVGLLAYCRWGDWRG